MPSSHADVLIIGAGASGGIAARRLAEEGFSVVALEQGQWPDRTQYRGSEWDWELAAGKRFSPLPALRQAPEDYPIDTSESDMIQGMFNGVGGSTNLFSAIWPRFVVSNFKTRSTAGVGDDWPLTYQDLLPFYERTDRWVGVSGFGGNPAYPPGADPPLPPLPLRDGGMLLARAFARKGWHWWPDTNAILSMPYDGRRACVQRGTCTNGCNEGAKSSFDAQWRHAVAHGAHVITGARVRRIVLDEKGLAAGAEWVDEDGAPHFQSADIVLCAANGVGTPRLLLASACAGHENGLVNSSDLVGRRLMLHPLSIVAGTFEQQLGAWQGSNGSVLQSMEFAENDDSRGFKLGAKWALQPTGIGPVGEALGVFAQHGPRESYHQRFRERLGHAMMFSILVEDLPEEHNRVVLSPDVMDSSGVPAPRLIYKTSENSLRCLAFNTERATEIMREAGAVRVESHSPAVGNAHFMGTARMGDDPRTSVVNQWCISHDIPNLGIIDGSVFVTSAAVNPTTTISALTLRAIEHLIAERRNVPTPSRSIQVALGPQAKPAKAEPAPAVTLDAEERTRFARLADALIPATDGMPAPSEIKIQMRNLDRVLSSRPDLGPALKQMLSVDFAEPAARHSEIEAKDPFGHRNLLTVIAAAYYLDPGVSAKIGYEGQVAIPFTPERVPSYITEGLLDHLLPQD